MPLRGPRGSASRCAATSGSSRAHNYKAPACFHACRGLANTDRSTSGGMGSSSDRGGGICGWYSSDGRLGRRPLHARGNGECAAGSYRRNETLLSYSYLTNWVVLAMAAGAVGTVSSCNHGGTMPGLFAGRASHGGTMPGFPGRALGALSQGGTMPGFCVVGAMLMVGKPLPQSLQCQRYYRVQWMPWAEFHPNRRWATMLASLSVI